MAFAALVDASALVASFGRGEARSEHYRRLFELASNEGWQLSTTWACLTEACHLLDVPRRYTLMRWIAAQAVIVFPIPQEALEEMADVMARYTQRPRQEMDLADASLYWVAADTGVARVMTTDVRDFSRYRLPDGRAFELL